MYAGHGSGATCDVCGDAIQPAQVEYELNYPDEPRTLRLHLHCVGLWEAVRLTTASIRRSSPSSRRSAGSTFRPALPIPIDWDDGGGP
jgi:hypothetical protein